MGYKTDRQRVEGLGTAHDGVHHFWVQRLTAVALVPLAILFVLPFAYNLGGDFNEVRAAYAHPINAIVAILFFGVMFRHLQLGLQVVIEDYVSGKAKRLTCLFLNTAFCWLFGLIAVFAVARIAFSA
ncbi:MAG: succinate dehydrogenase, hydrophobic membrane anchor protein [Paracoccaceae bacterium]